MVTVPNKKKGGNMPLYTIRIDGLTDTFKKTLQEEYDISEQVLLSEKDGQVIYDENDEEILNTFPRPVYGTVVAKELAGS